MKRVVLLRGCVEPGKDGVGDYCFMFASELRQQGLEVQICSMHDSYVQVPTKEIVGGVLVYRLPASLSWNQKVGLLRNYFTLIQPDHISLQFVIYAYDPKGLPFMAMHQIQRVLKKWSSVSIMLHEPWIGRSATESLKRRLIGFIQRQLIRKTIYNISPVVVHTSNSAFNSLLHHFGIKSRILPLFSNIPFVKDEQLQQVNTILAEKGIKVEEGALKIGLFGRLPLHWKSAELLRLLNNEKAIFFLLGKADHGKLEQLKAEAAVIAPNLQLIHLGEQPSVFVSGFLQYLDAGVAVTSPQIIGKSGVVAAYREHGLPVILAGQDEYFRQVSIKPETGPGYIFLDRPIGEQLQSIKKRKILNSRDTVARQWIQDTKCNIV